MVKFVGGFHSTLEFGHVVIISGRVKDEAENFTLNFMGANSLNAIPFHMNVVFGDNCQIIRNTKINGEFGVAENMGGLLTRDLNPLKSGENFIFYILIGLDRFHISINNIHFCDYIFRSSVKRIVSCQLVHDVEKVTQFDHRRVFPFSHPVYQTRLLQNLSFSNDLPSVLKEGNVMVLRASASGNPNGSFTLKFLVGRSEAQGFHMDVRFSSKKVFRNNSMNDRLELIEADAETYGGFPFEFEKTFKIALGFDKAGVRISVNGNFFCEYPYKARLSSFSGLKIRDKNDLSLRIAEIQHFKIDENLQSLDKYSLL